MDVKRLSRYRGAISVGFITLEIVLIQQTRLFLGHPTLAVTTILGVLLIGGGLGSDLAGRWPDAKKPNRLFITTILIVALALLWLLIWPGLSRSFFGLQTIGRGLIAVASILPLALLLGIPFPLGLWLVGQFNSGDHSACEIGHCQQDRGTTCLNKRGSRTAGQSAPYLN